MTDRTSGQQIHDLLQLLDPQQPVVYAAVMGRIAAIAEAAADNIWMQLGPEGVRPENIRLT